MVPPGAGDFVDEGLGAVLFSNTNATDMSLRAKTISSIANATKVSTPCTTAIDRIARHTSKRREARGSSA